MNLNIQSRTFRHGDLGFLGTGTTAVGTHASFILRMRKQDLNISNFISRNYPNVRESADFDPTPSSNLAVYIMFTITLVGVLRDGRKLLKSVADDLAKVESVAEYQRRCHAEAEFETNEDRANERGLRHLFSTDNWQSDQNQIRAEKHTEADEGIWY